MRDCPECAQREGRARPPKILDDRIPWYQSPLRLTIWGVAIYVVLASWRYRLAHPELTETQLFMQLGDALLWR